MGHAEPEHRLVDLIVAHMPGTTRDQAAAALTHDDVHRAAVALDAISTTAGPDPDPSGPMLFAYRLHTMAAAVLAAGGAEPELIQRARELAADHEHELARHLEVSLDEQAIDIDE